MIKKIIFFIYSPFCKRDYDRFGVEILERNGFDVEVWDLTKILNPPRLAYLPPDNINFKGCFFHSKKEAIAKIKNLKPDSFVGCFLSFNYESYCIFRTLSKCRIPYGIYSYNYPSFNVKRKYSIRSFSNLTLPNLFAYLFSIFPTKYLGICPASTVLALGGEINANKSLMGKETKILWSHIFDYEIYLSVMQQQIRTDETMWVFLDQNLSFNPDALGTTFSMPMEEYYPQLCRFFDYLEKTYGVHIVIAAHPRSQYKVQGNLFGNRPVIRGKTAELIKESRFVILHDSASVNYAVLFKKPIMFITTSLFQKQRNGLTDFIASLFGKKVLNIDQSFEFDMKKELSINEQLYENYKNIYIKKAGTDDTPAWQLFADYIKKHLNAGILQ